MAYYFYLGNVLLPVPPKKVDLKINNKNKTYDLINNKQINVLKDPGLTDIEFEVLLPNSKYPWATYVSIFRSARYYLDILERLKINKNPFQFIIVRKFPNNKDIYTTNIKVSVEDYMITDTTEEGFDNKVKLKLRQYREYSTKTIKISVKNKKTTVKKKKRTVTTNNTSKIPVKPKGQNYTVKRGDCLWTIAKKFYGDGSKYKVIYNANKKVIGGNPNLIYPNQVLWIPA